MPQNSLKGYQEDRFWRGVYDRRNVLNDLTGKEWLFSTKTIIPKVYPSRFPPLSINHDFRPLPIDLSQELIEIFTKPNGTILDPFAGFGSTLFAGYYSNVNSESSNRTIIGFDNDLSNLKEFRKVMKYLKITDLGKITYEPFTEIKHVSENSVNFILTDILNKCIPDLLFQETQFSAAIKEWVHDLANIFKISIAKLIKNSYMVITIPFYSNFQTNSLQYIQEWNFTLMKMITEYLNSLGVFLKAERFWFESSNSKEEISLITPQRRILVFRKESQSASNAPLLLFSKHAKLPLGPTFLLHRSFPPSFEHKLRSQHGGMKPPELIEYLIRRYSQKESEIILDPFVGVGGSLLGATLAHRNAIGIDINAQWQEVYSEVCRRMHLSEQTYIVGDSTQVIDKILEDESIGMIMTDVPYWAMDKLRKTRGRFSKAGEESREKLHSSLKKFDHAAILSIQEWQDLLESVFNECYKKLTNGSFLAVFIGNMYRTMTEQQAGRSVRVGRFLLLSSLLADILVSCGYHFCEEIVWYAPDKALHIFGYPYSYIPSVVHQSILIFKKIYS